MADYSRLSIVGIFTLFAVLTVKDLFISPTQSSSSTPKEIPVTRVGVDKFIGPTLKVLYCYSCGYRKAFDQYANLLQEKYPEIIVTGDNYQPSAVRTFLAQAVGLLKMAAVMCIVLGVNPFTSLGYQNTPSWWQWCFNNKIYACMMIFFMGNALEGQLVSTGAFEMFFNDVPVWSKLETGRIPQPPELFQILENQLQFQPQGASAFHTPTYSS
ncbi:thioredoxin reductase-like selenoprotein T homolog CG3887 [Neocloeon triangulifer]|uniref:thioredoxin reductase-like selenoprotein T homolog CG3887 n=1 Tax=Neocloeon triangulifer TaxID=2078957 RepID=UPI00286F8E54|nr:thioredoxin reductase-like selenoprotein T homolog CG3887 [Neocloeon triangulifer]XP_059480427.1 thioredoxin reductase-like selenoprotein T homolog CG3887 [Neocloeon triangulifer]